MKHDINHYKQKKQTTPSLLGDIGINQEDRLADVADQRLGLTQEKGRPSSSRRERDAPMIDTSLLALTRTRCSLCVCVCVCVCVSGVSLIK